MLFQLGKINTNYSLKLLSGVGVEGGEKKVREIEVQIFAYKRNESQVWYTYSMGI